MHAPFCGAHLRRNPVKRNEPPLRIRLIVNPAAGRGRARRSLGRVARAFAAERIVEIARTEHSGDEERLAEQAIADGIETIVAVGGDGTCSRIAGVIVAKESSCRLGVVPMGTGNDFAKTLGTSSMGYAAIAKLCAGSAISRMDVGRVGAVHFLNGCGFGIDPEILAETLSVTWLRGNAVYVWSALKKLFFYPGFIVGEGEIRAGAHHVMLTVSNGRYLGGAFKIAPEASVCDGLLDIHRFNDTTAWRRLRIFLSAFRGTHPRLPEVSSERRSSLHLRFERPPRMEVDGELRLAESASIGIECLPGALSVVAAPGFPL